MLIKVKKDLRSHRCCNFATKSHFAKVFVVKSIFFSKDKFAICFQSIQSMTVRSEGNL